MSKRIVEGNTPSLKRGGLGTAAIVLAFVSFPFWIAPTPGVVLGVMLLIAGIVFAFVSTNRAQKGQIRTNTGVETAGGVMVIGLILAICYMIFAPGRVFVSSPPPAPVAEQQGGQHTPEPVEPSAPVTPKAPQPEHCYNPGGVYTGISCHPGGDMVLISRVIDGDTVELFDGRRVRLLGVDAPEADTCAGPGATDFTRSKVLGQWVKMHTEPGVAPDKYGRMLAYVQYGAPYYSSDLGRELTYAGWATPDAGDANPT